MGAPRRAKKNGAKPTRKKASKRKAMDRALDDAIGKLGNILQEVGLRPPEPDQGTLPVPSRRLVFCDVGALSSVRPDGPTSSTQAGKRRVRGQSIALGVAALRIVVQDSLPGSCLDLFFVERVALTVRERPLGRLHPITGTFLAADADAITTLRRHPRQRIAPPDGLGPGQTFLEQADEKGLRLTPDGALMGLGAATSGTWKGRRDGQTLRAFHITKRHPLRVREGLDAEGRRTYLRIDSGQDGIEADPTLRRTLANLVKKAKRDAKPDRRKA